MCQWVEAVVSTRRKVVPRSINAIHHRTGQDEAIKDKGQPIRLEGRRPIHHLKIQVRPGDVSGIS
jgi:hypothetical protein